MVVLATLFTAAGLGVAQPPYLGVVGGNV